MSGVLTSATFVGGVVQPGHDVRFIREDVGSCSGITWYDDPHRGGVVDAASESNSSSMAVVTTRAPATTICATHRRGSDSYESHAGNCKAAPWRTLRITMT